MELFDKSNILRSLADVMKPYKINELNGENLTIDGLVSHPAIANDSTFHFHTLEPIKRADYITIEENYYMVINDVAAIRGVKYKAIIERCNYMLDTTTTKKVQVGTNAQGRPIYEEITVVGTSNPAIVKMQNVLFEGSQIQVAAKTLTVQLQDNDENRAYYVLNQIITLDSRDYKIMSVDYSQTNMINMRVELSVGT